MLKNSELLTIATNSIVSANDFTQFHTAENLITLNISGVNFTDNVNLHTMNLQNCNELSTLNFSNSTGLRIVNYKGLFIPLSWKHLTKLAIINFSNLGLTQIEVNELIKGLSSLVDNGLGGAINTAKTINLTGTNAKPLLTDGSVSDAKNNLIAKGWTITHS